MNEIFYPSTLISYWSKHDVTRRPHHCCRPQHHKEERWRLAMPLGLRKPIDPRGVARRGACLGKTNPNIVALSHPL